MDVIILLNVTPEDSEGLQITIDKILGKNKTLSEAERAKRYREKQKSSQIVTENVTDVTNVTENVTKVTEESEDINNININNINNELNILKNKLNKNSNEKIIFGSQKNVLLTQDEYEKIKEKFPDYEEKINNMSLYFESKGNANKYKSHYATLLNWDRMEKERSKQNGKPPEKSFHDIRLEMEDDEDIIDSFWKD